MIALHGGGKDHHLSVRESLTDRPKGELKTVGVFLSLTGEKRGAPGIGKGGTRAQEEGGVGEMTEGLTKTGIVLEENMRRGEILIGMKEGMTDIEVTENQTDTEVIVSLIGIEVIGTQIDTEVIETLIDTGVIETLTDTEVIGTQTDTGVIETQTDTGVIGTQTDIKGIGPQSVTVVIGTGTGIGTVIELGETEGKEEKIGDVHLLIEGVVLIALPGEMKAGIDPGEVRNAETSPLLVRGVETLHLVDGGWIESSSRERMFPRGEEM